MATEEAWCIPEVAAALREVSGRPGASLDKPVAGIYEPKTDTSGYSKMKCLDGLLDVEARRLKKNGRL